MKFCLVDVSNLVHRAKHVVSGTSDRSDLEDRHYAYDQRIGMILNIVFLSLRKAYDKFEAQHCIACFDSRSWRRDVMGDYKANRREKVRTPKEIEDAELINKAIDEFRDFLRDFTNVTVLEAKGVEADDFIGRWVQLHHDEAFQHVIISADSDFKQLVRPGVELYMPMTHTLSTIEGVFYQDGKKAKKTDTIVHRYGESWKVKKDKKSGDPLTFDPKWELFEKCIRGDASDNIKSAWPRVSTKAMKRAFYGGVEDWNNFIHSTWGPDNENSVFERYNQNRQLIDLTAQPEYIKELIDETIADALDAEHKKLVGAYFAKFCSRFGLNNLMKQADSISQILASSYND